MSPTRKQSPPASRPRAVEPQEIHVPKATPRQVEEEAKVAYDEMVEAALPADPDLVEDLMNLRVIAAALRPDPELKARYEAMRDELVARVKGKPRFFIDEQGQRVYAHAQIPARLIVDTRLLEDAEMDNKLSYEVLDEVAPRKVDMPAFRRAIAAGRVPDDVLVTAASMVDGTGYVRFVTAAESEGEDE